MRAQRVAEVEERDVDARTEAAADVTAASEELAAAAEQPTEHASTDDGAEETDPDATLSAVAAERDGYLELAQRTQAEFDNYRRRAARDAAAAGARAKAALVRELLPVVDNLERALASGSQDEAGLAGGVRLVHAEVMGVLRRSGIEAFEPSGEAFDPTLHEALSTRAGEGEAPGTVLDVVEKGYRLNETVLRPARVVVSA